MLTPERQTCKILACAQARLTWGCSSAGRASRSQRGGRGFESHHLHHVFSAGQAIAWPVLFCTIKGFEPLRSIRVKKQPSGLFLANREEALADEVKRAKRDSESHHLHHVLSKAVLTNGLFYLSLRRPLAAHFKVRVASASAELHSREALLAVPI